MAKEYTLKAVSSLFEEKLSERSGPVKDVKAAESILREFETTPTTRYACFKASKGFGNTGKGLSILFMIACTADVANRGDLALLEYKLRGNINYTAL